MYFILSLIEQQKAPTLCQPILCQYTTQNNYFEFVLTKHIQLCGINILNLCFVDFVELKSFL